MVDIAWVLREYSEATDTFRRELRNAGIGTDFFFDAQSMLWKMSGGQFPLIITDLFIPPGTMYDPQLREAWCNGSGNGGAYARVAEHLVQRLRVSEPRRPILAVGTYLSSDKVWSGHIQKILQAGANEYFDLGFHNVGFPESVDEFAEKVRRYLGR